MLQGLPISSVLNCAIELWRNLEIDDDELLEIAIRDVSYQIQLQKEREESKADDSLDEETISQAISNGSTSHITNQQRFDPQLDPTGKCGALPCSRRS